MKQITGIMLVGLLLSFATQAASFDCGKVKSKVEKLICADVELSQVDEELAAAYKIVLQELQDAQQTDAIRQTQKQWLQKRNDCSDAACVKRAYEARLQKLSSPVSASDIRAAVQRRAAPPEAKKRCYKLVVGKRFAMCREFEKNLNRYCDEPPMMCRFKINPDFGKDFSTPKWEGLDPAKNLDLVTQIMLSHYNAPSVAIHPENVNCNQECAEREWQRVKPGYMEGIRAGRVVLSRARFDLNHDGTPELVYRLSGSQCSPDDLGSGHQYFTLMVMDERNGKEDPDFATYHNAGVDILLYQGRAHLVDWRSDRILDGRAELGTSTRIPNGMAGGYFSIHDILTGDQNVGRYYPLLLPLCGYNYLVKERK